MSQCIDFPPTFMTIYHGWLFSTFSHCTKMSVPSCSLILENCCQNFNIMLHILALELWDQQKVLYLCAIFRNIESLVFIKSFAIQQDNKVGKHAAEIFSKITHYSVLHDFSLSLFVPLSHKNKDADQSSF